MVQISTNHESINAQNGMQDGSRLFGWRCSPAPRRARPATRPADETTRAGPIDSTSTGAGSSVRSVGGYFPAFPLGGWLLAFRTIAATSSASYAPR
jgi:hypothetical protein